MDDLLRKNAHFHDLSSDRRKSRCFNFIPLFLPIPSFVTQVNNNHSKEVLELINKKIKDNYKPGRILVIDEWLAFFSGADNPADKKGKV